MKISFVLPGFIKIPMGGVKVVHEYANHLVDRGHFVSLVYPLNLSGKSIISNIRRLLFNIYDKLTNIDFSLWYSADPRVKIIVIKKPISKYIPEGDCIIAVGWQTATVVHKLPKIHGKKFYLLQSFETYFRNKKSVIKTYYLPLKKIAISQWIIDELKAIGESGHGPLGNAVNPDEFLITNPNGERNHDIMMMYHHHKIKGARDGIKVLKAVKRAVPELKAIIVAPRKPIHIIPKWIEVIIRPSILELRELYNSTKIFLHTSHWEGWGLPVMEAMACGCAVVAAENKGVKEYLTHEYNALLSPIGNIKSLTTQVTLLLNNTKLLNKLTCNGLRSVKQYSWDATITHLENILMDKM